jgi:hypothetical protein
MAQIVIQLPNSSDRHTFNYYEEVVDWLRSNDITLPDSNEEYMEVVRDRKRRWDNIELQSTSAKEFVHDMAKHGYIQRVLEIY